MPDTWHCSNAGMRSSHGQKHPFRLAESGHFSMQVEEGATYAVLSSKVHYVFLKRGPGPSELYISRTYEAEKEPVGPILVALAAKGLSEPARSPCPNGPPDQTRIQPCMSHRTAAAKSAAAQIGDGNPGPEDTHESEGDITGNGPSSNPKAASMPYSQGTRSKGKRPAESAGQSTRQKRENSGLPNASSPASSEQAPQQGQSPAAAAPAPASGTRPDSIAYSVGVGPACSGVQARVEDVGEMPDYPRHALDIGAGFYHGDTFVVRSPPPVNMRSELALCSRFWFFVCTTMATNLIPHSACP